MKNSIVKKYKELPLPMKATVWLSICQILQRGINILSTPLITRMLSTTEYGRVSMFTSWENVFLVVITLSSGHAVMNLCVKSKEHNKMLSGLMGYNLLVSFIWGIILLLTNSMVSKFTGLSYMLVWCLYLACVSLSIINCWTYLKQYEYCFKSIIIETMFYSFGTSFGALFGIAFISRTAEMKIITQVYLSVMIGLVILINTFRKGKVFYDKDIWKFAFCFCVPLLPHYFSEIILMSSDRIMIDQMCGSSDVAIYSIAYSVGSLINIVASAVNSAFNPYQYQKISSKEYKALAKNTNYIIAFVAFCLCGVMLFGREVVLIFGGQKYIDSISLIIPISLGVFFNYVFQLFARVQEYFEQKHTIVIASISCALLNIVLNYIFINLYGYKAAAYTTFVCYFSFCFLHYLFYRKACKKYVGQEIYDIKGLALISAVLMILALIISFISKLFILKYVILAAALIVMIWQRKRILDFIKTIREK